MSDYWKNFWFKEVPLLPLCYFRIATGLIMSLYMCDKFYNYKELLSTDGFHLPESASVSLQPFYFAPLSPEHALYLVGAFCAVLVTFTLGFLTRISTILLFILFFYVSMIDVVSAFTINKVFLYSLLILTFAPAGEKLSIDAYLSGEGKDYCSAWTIRTLQVLLVFTYLVAGLCKALPGKGHWLIYDDVLYTQLGGIFQTDMALFMLKNIPKDIWLIIQYQALAFELFAPVLFIYKRTRTFIIICGIAFHLVIAATMHMLLPFSLQMISFYLFFIPFNQQENIQGSDQIKN